MAGCVGRDKWNVRLWRGRLAPVGRCGGASGVGRAGPLPSPRRARAPRPCGPTGSIPEGARSEIGQIMLRVLVARQGKHIVMTDGVRILTIPRHNPVNALTMGGIVRDAGLTLDAFKALL